MFKITDNKFNSELVIRKAINTHPYQHSIEYFHKDGYELTPLELEYYKTNNIPIGNHLRHVANQFDWIVCDRVRSRGPRIDHSMIAQRWGFGDDAKKQLTEYSRYNPAVWSLLQIKQKWGVDFSLDYVDYTSVTELFHIEIDRYTLEEIVCWKERVEQFVLNTDFEDAYKRVKALESDIMNSDDLTDAKVRLFGFERAFDNRKTY